MPGEIKAGHREEVRMFSAIVSYQFVENSHPHLLAELNLKDKTGVETNVVDTGGKVTWKPVGTSWGIYVGNMYTKIQNK